MLARPVTANGSLAEGLLLMSEPPRADGQPSAHFMPFRYKPISNGLIRSLVSSGAFSRSTCGSWLPAWI